jgi:hypothetical protein
MDLDEIIKQLNARKQRATYGAVAKLVGVSPSELMAGRPRDPTNSWVVAATTSSRTGSQRGYPTGYAINQIDPECRRQIRQGSASIIQDAEVLRRWLTG